MFGSMAEENTHIERPDKLVTIEVLRCANHLATGQLRFHQTVKVASNQIVGIEINYFVIFDKTPDVQLIELINEATVTFVLGCDWRKCAQVPTQLLQP